MFSLKVSFLLLILLFYIINFSYTLAQYDPDPDLNRVLMEPDNHNAGNDEDEDDEEEDEDEANEQAGDVNVQTSYIEGAFNNRRTFTCPLVKQLLATGTSVADLSPEDIDIIAAMGDALSTGLGLYNGKNIEFRGSVFTVGGDANIDGLVTFANILSMFNPKLGGVSHGMGTALPSSQFNVAQTGAETDGMPEQARQLISRLRQNYSPEELSQKWVLLFMTIGTEELCAKCDMPNSQALHVALNLLRKSVPKILVVLVGPVHVSRSSQLTYNLLKPRCACLSKISDQQLQTLQQKWRLELKQIEAQFAQRHYNTFSLLVLSKLQIRSRFPQQLFIAEKPLLNRRGHTYAAKWLWNRLIAGPKYNVSDTPLSQESYFCPSLGCPYFRTPANFQHCLVLTKSEYARLYATPPKPMGPHDSHKFAGIRQIRDHLLVWILALVLLSTMSVLFFGTIFFCHGIKATKGRFELTPGV